VCHAACRLQRATSLAIKVQFILRRQVASPKHTRKNYFVGQTKPERTDQIKMGQKFYFNLPGHGQPTSLRR